MPVDHAAAISRSEPDTDQAKDSVPTIEGNSTPTNLRELRASENPLSTIAENEICRGSSVVPSALGQGA